MNKLIIYNSSNKCYHSVSDKKESPVKMSEMCKDTELSQDHPGVTGRGQIPGPLAMDPSARSQ